MVEELGDELLVYDLTNDRAHALSAPAARVWRACDGSTTIDGLGAALGLDTDVIRRSIDELDTCELLEAAPSLDGGSTRRELTLRIAKVGAAAAAIPLIVSVVAPTASQAVTPTEEFCQAIIVVGHGCGQCHMEGCCCCQPPEGSTKPCHASCLPFPSECMPTVGEPPNCNGPTAICKFDQ